MSTRRNKKGPDTRARRGRAQQAPRPAPQRPLGSGGLHPAVVAYHRARLARQPHLQPGEGFDAVAAVRSMRVTVPTPADGYNVVLALTPMLMDTAPGHILTRSSSTGSATVTAASYTFPAAQNFVPGSTTHTGLGRLLGRDVTIRYIGKAFNAQGIISANTVVWAGNGTAFTNDNLDEACANTRTHPGAREISVAALQRMGEVTIAQPAMSVQPWRSPETWNVDAASFGDLMPSNGEAVSLAPLKIVFNSLDHTDGQLQITVHEYVEVLPAIDANTVSTAANGYAALAPRQRPRAPQDQVAAVHALHGASIQEQHASGWQRLKAGIGEVGHLLGGLATAAEKYRTLQAALGGGRAPPALMDGPIIVD